MPANKVLAIVGMCGAGKSIAASVFVKSGWEKVHFGQITMEEINRRGLPTNEQNERLVREELRKIHGSDAYAKLLLPKIKNFLLSGNVVLDGLYSFSEYQLLKTELGDKMLVMAIVSDRNKRYARLLSRNTRPLSNSEAESRDYAEIINLEKGGPIAIADFFILNNSSLDEFENNISSFIRIISEQ